MQEIEPAKVSKTVKQKEVVMVPVKVKRKKVEKRRVTKLRRKAANTLRVGRSASGELWGREGGSASGEL